MKSVLWSVKSHNHLSLAGADPTHQIEDLARKHKIVAMGVSMGQGQEVVARKILQVASTDGCWVLLQNAHLGLAYVSEVGVGNSWCWM